jgi:hypothetical protein
MSGMCCEQLACANCTRPVVEASCPTCRAARAELHGASPALNLAVIALLVTALLAAAAVLYGRFAG